MLMEEAQQLGRTTSLHTNEKNPNDIGMTEIAERRRSSTTRLPQLLTRETSSSRTQPISNDRDVDDVFLTVRATMTAEEPQQPQQHLRQERRRNHTEEDAAFPSWISNDSASLSSDDSPIVPIRLYERSLLDREMDSKLSHRVWEDVKRRLHLLNVYLGIDTDEDESYSHLFDDHSDNEDHSSYAASDRTATTAAFSMESSVHSDDFEYGDDDDSRIIRRIPS
ncbi:hypothetical protein IV203_022538 [Nitzschia inconspicua]|uniref:Uncharacterized protein n=1 Tax=Nitzschia inconspicua TaxID=303405 RepID=A0A9K3PEQ2_9STRA|nr:hypothetical protein IV203_022538 [Nitzschia inconspicua]